MIKHIVFGLFILLLASCHGTSNETKEPSSKEMMFVKTAPFQTPAGWGYEIYVDDKLYIRQAFIPALPGNKGFATRQEALEVGRLVIQKMAAEKKMPRITLSDLQQLHIQEAY